MSKPVVYVLINGELKMSPGKAIAQASHAVIDMAKRGIGIDGLPRTVIVLEAKNQIQMLNLQSYARQHALVAEVYIDEGVNEIDPYNITAMAISGIDADDLDKREIFRQFPLYPEHKPKWYNPFAI